MQNEALEAAMKAFHEAETISGGVEAAITAYQSHWLSKRGEVVEALQVLANWSGTSTAATNALALIASLAAENAAKDAELFKSRNFWSEELSKANARIAELVSAGTMVLDGLNQRIDAAPSNAKPVFHGIADLHDALGHARSLTKEGRDNG